MQESNLNATGMEYNTDLPPMVISEYGRSVQRMIDICLTIEDRNERNRCARTIIKAMALLNPQLKEYQDYEHKLWDHLHIMSDYKLDVDSPYPKPEANVLAAPPERVAYPQSDIRFRHYGKILEDLVRKAIKEEDPKNREIFTGQLAQLMKKHYLNWNRDSVNDQLIIEQLDMLSKGQLKVAEDFKFLHTNDILPRNAVPANQQPQFATNKKKNNNKKKKGKY
ncbi:MAG: DUF4290 domain-containing protein [Bacteroidetes bacterium]|nr:DUF4290 domain-containing protein [Bacteroidota bacterium]